MGYVTPKDMLEGNQKQIHTQRDLKLEAARQTRQLRRQQAANITQQNPSDSTGLGLQ